MSLKTLKTGGVEVWLPSKISGFDEEKNAYLLQD